jgi:4-hydroxy-2-oxoheptanedioate aldolase
MRENRLRRIWSEGRTATGLLVVIPSAYSAEVLAHQGWDFLFVDMQHGAIDERAATDMLTAISTTDTTPLVRVRGLDPGMVGKMLDVGAYGIICPMIDTAEEARRFVAACRYPPHGNRSWGPFRARLYGDYLEHANETVLTIAMIETREALENLEEIVAVPGLDAVYVGPSDLSFALGLTPKFDQEEEPFLEVVERIAEAAGRHGVVAGIHNGTAAYTRRMIELGFRLCSISTDVGMMTAGCQDVLELMAVTD